jgi:hypothetical protein
MSKNRALWFIQISLALLGGYIASALLVFDFSAVAYPHDEEYFGDRHVAFGPQPRFRLCRAAYESGYDGSEWALIIYRPICQAWATRRGFAPPQAWR